MLKPGGNVDSWCGKCKLILAHTIEALVGDKPARVHCNTCKAQHSYKPYEPGGVSQHGDFAVARDVTKPGRRGRTATKRSLRGKQYGAREALFAEGPLRAG